MDLLLPEEQQALTQAMVDALQWEGPVYAISALSGDGCEALCADVMAYIEREAESDNDESHLAADEETPEPRSEYLNPPHADNEAFDE